jgi:kynurenine 3-monooxygenase
MNLGEEEGAHFHFQHRCVSIDWSANRIHFEMGGGKMISTDADLIFAADGAFSATRLQYQLHHDRFQYQQSYIDFGYKELTIPAGADGGFQMEPNALHIWTGPSPARCSFPSRAILLLKVFKRMSRSGHSLIAILPMQPA